MKVIINRTTEDNVSDVPFESFDLRVEADSMVDHPTDAADTYMKLRKKLMKGMKEETK